MMRSIGSASSASGRGIAAIVGVGPNLGRSIARKFAHEGYTVAILARDLGRLSRLAEEIAREEKSQVFAIRIDCSDSRSVREAFEGVLSLGFVEVLVYNAAYHHPPPPAPSVCPHHSPTSFPDTTRLHSFEKSLAVSTVGAFHCAHQVLRGMVERGRGTILFTGCSASLTGIAGCAELCCGKFALRALSQCLAREFQPLGVHVAHVVIDGLVGAPVLPREGASSTTWSTAQRWCPHGEQQRGGGGGGGEGGWMEADAVAQTYWYLHVQDRSAWTQEIDLRPSALLPHTSLRFSSH
ncbi:uncharacterized protein LOC131159066 [Malania oleifera]|uniref:uncharacterized protein LOC131159066 n=1 Tax=Malania oleifera TaxID=397392 RepID=UPI0025ADC5F3|nr:uncharacterized protein LOC131159066 [Malania oleifera]